MRIVLRAPAVALCSLGSAAVGCSPPRRPPVVEAGAGLDALNARLVQAYRARDPDAYAALYTDTAVFEWPSFPTARGRAGLAAMARGNWAGLGDMDLRLTVAARRLAPDGATEFGAFEQSWRDARGVRNTEFGRYVAFAVRQADGRWRLDRFFGFSDSTRPPAPRP